MPSIGSIAFSLLDTRLSRRFPLRMTIFTSQTPLKWGELDVPMLGLEKDWHGTTLQPPAAYALATDPRRLWFIAHHRRPARDCSKRNCGGMMWPSCSSQTP